MKNLIFIYVACLIFTSSCISIEKSITDMYRSEMYIDHKFISYKGTNSKQKIQFEIDSINSLKYWGHLVINEVDTIRINGYEKGGFYPSWYQTDLNEERKMMEIWCRVKQAQIPDSLEICDRDTTTGLIKEKTILYRQPRNNCQ